MKFKKIYISLLVLMSMILFIPNVYAYEFTTDYDINTAFSIQDIGWSNPEVAYYLTDTGWTYTTGADVFDSFIYVNSPKVFIDAEILQYVEVPNYVIHYDGTTETNIFDMVYLYFYESKSSTTPSGYATLSNTASGELSTYKLNTPRNMETSGKWMQIVGGLDLYKKGGQLSYDTHQKIKTIINGNPTIENTYANRLRLYTASFRLSFNQTWIDNVSFLKDRGYESIVTLRHSSTTNPPEETTVGDLPTTDDNLLGNVFFEVDDYKVDVTIWYQGNPYLISFNFTDSTDMSLFNTHEAYFLNKENKPQIYINKSKDRLYLRDILSADSELEPAFVPHVIWDLNTNELKSIDKYNAYAYIKQNNEGVLVAYYYVDSFIMDNVLSTTLTYTSRQHTKNWFGIVDKRTDWTTYSWTYTNDKYLEYRDLSSHWSYWIPGWNLIFANIRKNTILTMPRIESVDFYSQQSYYNITKSELELAYSSVDSKFINIKDNPRYKVWAFALQEGKSLDMGWIGKVQTEFYNNEANPDDPRNLKIIEMVYETDGKLYTTVGEDMNLKIVVQPKIDGIKNETESNFNLILILVIVIIILVLILLFSRPSAARPVVRNVYVRRSRGNYQSGVSPLIAVLSILFIIGLLILALSKGWFS
ncbi:hypothetical protein [Acholeplasma hippikon]|uniref:Uncharacterized protein n=1 Tax=Acholeplasma hippikon TaxID=264636 RepID=A0A449BJV8_9MOLU|nr:hypothetical protein [Acholeplasma hippikon]VEU82755.1 Uncharacterised protein [Acholeplasma hippikon]